MDKFTAMIWEIFRFEEIERESDGGLRLRIRKNGGSLSVNLPKPGKHVQLHRSEKQVQIRAWLAAKVGLI